MIDESSFAVTASVARLIVRNYEDDLKRFLCFAAVVGIVYNMRSQINQCVSLRFDSHCAFVIESIEQASKSARTLLFLLKPYRERVNSFKIWSFQVIYVVSLFIEVGVHMLNTGAQQCLQNFYLRVCETV
ncbi:unnamed protein product [Albugo candida]|uniref:Uncharacterized protein n=1 Tax=Albugo candida TaxID=65357 RepID=A0A024GS05_9STRA|nr:unnamed protein product [Albugo candida]|eukprot:CCI49562.1 unnamed protein product [Albugo candida]